MATLRQFRYFISIVELGSMTRAAEQLNVAQPALGLQVKQLEEEFGVALLQRHSRGVTPTTAGQLLHERAKDVLDLVERTRREMTALAEETAETIRLGLSPSLMQLVATDLLVRARQDLPRLTIRLVEELSFLLLDLLQRGELDMALAYDLPTQPGIESRPLLQEDLLFVTAPSRSPGANEGGIVGDITMAEALAADLSLPGPRDAVRQIVGRAADTLGLEPRVIFEVQSTQAMKILAMDGIAATILPYGVARRELLDGRLVGRRLTPGLRRTLYLVRSERRTMLRDEAGLLRVLETTGLRVAELLGSLSSPIGAPKPISGGLRT